MIAENKPKIIAYLTARLERERLACREQDWLAAIAGHLGTVPPHLLDADPAAVARLVRSDPRWLAEGGR
ncbi:hypothetical protein D3C78_1590960 [compost metagenome]